MKDIKDFYQTIKIKNKDETLDHQIFDYKKIWEDKEGNDEPLLYFVISERGMKAKTTQAKYLARYIWNKFRSKTLWVMNNNKLIEKEKKSHLTKPKQFHKDIFTGNEIVKGDNVFVGEEDNETKEWYQKFVGLTTAENEKGSRDDYELIILDEFNVGDRMIKSSKVDLFSSLLATADDPINNGDENSKKLRKIIIHGNNKTLNDRFLVDLGVYKIDKEVTNLEVDGKVIGRILYVIPNKEEKQIIIDRNKDNSLYLLQKKLGKAEHVYFNESLFDEVNYVSQAYMLLPYLQEFTIKVKQDYIKMRIVQSQDLGNIVYFFKDEKSDGCVAINKRSVSENVKYAPHLKNNILKELGSGKVWFYSSSDREIILDEVTK